MSKSPKPIPPGHENLIPHLVCDPCSKAIEFYKKAFGAEEVHRMPAPDGGRIMHAAIRIGNSFVFLVDDFPEFCEGKSQSPKALKGTPVTIHHYVDDCDAAIKRAVDAGAKVLDAGSRHVLGRSLRHGRRSIRPSMVVRNAHQKPHSGTNASGDEGGFRASAEIDDHCPRCQR